MSNFVVNLVAHASIDLLADALYACVAQQFSCGQNTLAHVANRISIACDEENRQAFGNLGSTLGSHDFSRKVEQRRIAANGEHESAQIIGDIGVNNFFVGGKPVERRAGVLDLLAIRTSTHVVDEGAPMLVSPYRCKRARHEAASLGKRCRDIARTREHAGCEVIAICGNVGQDAEDLEWVKQKAYNMGAIYSDAVDLRKSYASRVLKKAIAANALYENTYPLLSALSRPMRYFAKSS